MSSIEIRVLGSLDDRAISELSAVLIDCVEGGASVGFVLPMTREKAAAFWAKVAASAGRGERVVLVAEAEGGVIVGTVQLILDMPENGAARGEVAKMLVKRSARRRGVAGALLAAAEDAARRAGKTTLVLDTVTGSDADRLYTRCGWTRVGEIPAYAVFPDGTQCSTTYFYKCVAAGA